MVEFIVNMIGRTDGISRVVYKADLPADYQIGDTLVITVKQIERTVVEAEPQDAP